ncbi:hypothetical protein J7L48_01270 [bacterium]|nr:hypothetical protein [bacterium]
MNKTQKSIVTVEIIVIALGLLILIYGLLNSGGGSRKQYISKVQTLKKTLEDRKQEYKDNDKIVALYAKEAAKLDEIIKKYEDKSFKFDKDTESRKYLNLENNIACFMDDCKNIKISIQKTQAYIDNVNKYFEENKNNIRTVKKSTKIKKTMRRKIAELEKSLNSGLENLRELINKVQTPDDATNLSLKQLELEQPFAEFKNNVKIAYEITQETKVELINNPIEIEVTPKPVQTRRIKKTKNAELIAPYSSSNYPAKFKGTGLCVIKINIGKDGVVKTTSVFQSSNNKEFDDFCKSAAKTLKYKPAIGYYRDDPAKKEFPIETSSKYPFMAPTK